MTLKNNFFETTIGEYACRFCSSDVDNLTTQREAKVIGPSRCGFPVLVSGPLLTQIKDLMNESIFLHEDGILLQPLTCTVSCQ